MTAPINGQSPLPLIVGQQRPLRMRRIGAEHVVVLPPQVAKVVSLRELEQALAVAQQQERKTQQQLDAHRAYMADLQRQIAAIRELPIERVADDPDVPQPPSDA